ncbi:peptide ABC transporter substrate-binding protein [Bartonella sp. DGB2]|uniref:peptide ABC transporter substrate-binding protein n=1 Tax=Bartonella sp. DGB2 TaxID=3388426 RepID=UPI00398FB2E0
MICNKTVHTLLLCATTLSVGLLPLPVLAIEANDKHDTVIYNNTIEPPTLDPQLAGDTTSDAVISQLFEGLTVRDNKGQTVSGVAKSWDNKDNLIWTFHLREDSRWSDGSPVTAQDFVYSFRRLVDPKTASPNGMYLAQAYVKGAAEAAIGKASVEDLGVKAIDDHTLEITLTQPLAYFIDMLALPALSPVKQSVIEKYGDSWTKAKNIVVNGPYLLTNHVVNEKIEFKKNPTYWDRDHVTIPHVIFLEISNPLSAYNRYRANELHIAVVSFPVTLLEKAKKEYPQEYHRSPIACTSSVAFNMKKVADVRVRKALQLAFDRDAIDNKVFKGSLAITYSLTPTYMNNANFTIPDEISNLTQKQRNEKARKLLEEAGYNKNNPLVLTYSYATAPSNQQFAIALAAMYKQNIDVIIKLDNQEWKTLLQNTQQGNFEFVQRIWCADYNDPSTFLDTLMTSNSNNMGSYHSADFDKLMAEVLTAPNATALHALYQKAEDLIARDAPIIPYATIVSNTLRKPWLKGLGESPFPGTSFKFYSIEN